jgi:hypothetical protein
MITIPFDDEAIQPSFVNTEIPTITKEVFHLFLKRLNSNKSKWSNIFANKIRELAYEINSIMDPKTKQVLFRKLLYLCALELYGALTLYKRIFEFQLFDYISLNVDLDNMLTEQDYINTFSKAIANALERKIEDNPF